MKNSKDYLSEANALVERVSVEEGIDLHKNKGAVFVDVRDSAAIAESGTINGALRIPRGFIEFAADPDSPFHNAELNRDATIILVCGAGGQAALAGKTLKEMGYESVRNIGGFAGWRDAGGETEAA
jgi:rhodanese-related sulfurtransferase